MGVRRPTPSAWDRPESLRTLVPADHEKDLAAGGGDEASILPPRPLDRSAQAGDRIRTGDPQLGKLMLYQLSYARNCSCNLGPTGKRSSGAGLGGGDIPPPSPHHDREPQSTS